MKKQMITIAAAIFFVLALIPAAHAADSAKAAATAAEKAGPVKKHVAAKPEALTVTGTIVENKNNQGKIIGYALQEENGHSMMLSRHGKGMMLRKMVGSKVEATGTLKKSKGAQMMTVQKFKKI